MSGMYCVMSLPPSNIADCQTAVKEISQRTETRLLTLRCHFDLECLSLYFMYDLMYHVCTAGFLCLDIL